MNATATVNAGVRKAILAAADSPRVGRFVRTHGMRLGAARFVAGETFADAIPVLRSLNDRGLRANTTLLGEGVRERAETERVVAEYTEILDGIAEHGLRCNVALKLTHLGLDIDEELAYENVERLVAHAGERLECGRAHFQARIVSPAAEDRPRQGSAADRERDAGKRHAPVRRGICQPSAG